MTAYSFAYFHEISDIFQESWRKITNLEKMKMWVRILLGNSC